MYNSTILKLRQEESDPTENNGSWQTNLSQSVRIEEGDQIQIKSAFIDTAAETVIVVDKDFTAQMTTAKYLTNYYTSDDTAATNPFADGSAGTSGGMTYTLKPGGEPLLKGPDNQKYWSCDISSANGRNQLLESILILPIRERHFGDLNFQMQVRDPKSKVTGTTNADFTTLPGLFIGPKRWKDNKKGVIFPLSAWVNVTPGTLPQDNIRLVPFKTRINGTWEDRNMYTPLMSSAVFSPTAQTNSFLSPITDTVDIPIPEGEYTPVELSQIITDRMSLLQQPGRPVGLDYATGKFLVNSPFLSSTFQHYWKVFQELTDPTNPDSALRLPPPAADNSTNIYIREDGQAIFSDWGRAQSDDADTLLGCNNASLNFDATLNKLNFDVLHFPVQVASGGVNVPGIKYTPTNPTNPTKFPHDTVTSYSGVGLVNLEPAEFWAGLGFNSDNCVQFIQGAVTDTFEYTTGFFETVPGTPVVLNPAKKTTHVLTVPTKVGVTVTDQYAGMDLVVNRGVADAWMHPFLNTDGDASSITNALIGNRQFNTSSNNDGFFMINIGVKLPQNMISSNNIGVTGSNQMQSIVGKFYTQNNFLQDQGEGSVSYTHTGQPQLLSSFDINILNGDGSFPVNTDIGSNNTIFLEVIKAVRPPSPPPGPSVPASPTN